MNQEMSGEQKLETQLDDILDKYSSEKNVFVPNVDLNTLTEYLNMDRGYIESLSRDDRYGISYQLSQYSFYILKLYNREKARISWATSVINNLCARHWDEYDKYLKADIKIALIGRENKVVEKLLKIKNHAQIRVDELTDVSNHIKHLSDIIYRSAYGRE